MVREELGAARATPLFLTHDHSIMSAFDRFRAPGSDLASFFRSLVTPSRRYAATDESSITGDWQWEQLRAKQGGAKHIDFFDHDLRGADGARAVLEALKQNPGAASITLVSRYEEGEHTRFLTFCINRAKTNWAMMVSERSYMA